MSEEIYKAKEEIYSVLEYMNVLLLKLSKEDLRYINDPFYCPHGRPIIIKFTEYELNKKFRRII